MTDEEIQTAILDETLDSESLDYEGKLKVHADKLGKKFTRLYVDEVDV